MDVLNAVIQVPSWAYDFCYYYFAVAVIVALYSIYSMIQLFLVPSAYKRFIPFLSTVLALGLSSVVSIVLALMQVWVCRSALKPTAAKKEAFAVACKTGEDCTAVAGTPQPSTCSCGGRGVCGGVRGGVGRGVCGSVGRGVGRTGVAAARVAIDLVRGGGACASARCDLGPAAGGKRGEDGQRGEETKREGAHGDTLGWGRLVARQVVRMRSGGNQIERGRFDTPPALR